MTAPDMESIIAAALLAHPVTRTGHCECGARVHWATPENVAAHQARAVLTAISEAGAVEWGVKWAYLSEMYPERTDWKESREAAQASLDKSFADGVVVSRITFHVAAVEG